jgi:antitoxin component of RelBE/YafQ-DinJ toxin-antitoxin module
MGENMAASDMVTARVPREIKRQAEIVLRKQGMTPTGAINRVYDFIASAGEFPENAIPDPHAFPEPGERRLDANTLDALTAESPEQRQRLEAFARHRSFMVQDWGEYLRKPYKKIIAEGRRRDYEALSRH